MPNGSLHAGDPSPVVIAWHMANGRQPWQLGLSCDEVLSDIREHLVCVVGGSDQLPDRRGKRPPRGGGEREYGAAAVCRVTDQYGPSRRDFYAFSAVGA
jgi:hypothetical protein